MLLHLRQQIGRRRREVAEHVRWKELSERHEQGVRVPAVWVIAIYANLRAIDDTAQTTC
jgi:hypothetical protein